MLANDQTKCLVVGSVMKEQEKAFECRVGMSFYNSGLQNVRVWVDWCFWPPGLAGLGNKNARLEIKDLPDYLVPGLMDCAITIPIEILNPLLGQTPRRVLAELHVLIPQQLQDPSKPRNAGTVISLPESTNQMHMVPQEGGFATTGRAQLESASSVATVVRAGLVDILKSWGVDKPERALPEIPGSRSRAGASASASANQSGRTSSDAKDGVVVKLSATGSTSCAIRARAKGIRGQERSSADRLYEI